MNVTEKRPDGSVVEYVIPDPPLPPPTIQTVAAARIVVSAGLITATDLLGFISAQRRGVIGKYRFTFTVPQADGNYMVLITPTNAALTDFSVVNQQPGFVEILSSVDALAYSIEVKRIVR